MKKIFISCCDSNAAEVKTDSFVWHQDRSHVNQRLASKVIMQSVLMVNPLADMDISPQLCHY